MTQNKYFKPFECKLVFILVYWARIINYCNWYNIFCNHQELRYLTVYLRRLLNFILDALLRFSIVNWPINWCILLVRIEISYREGKPVSSPSLSLQRQKCLLMRGPIIIDSNLDKRLRPWFEFHFIFQFFCDLTCICRHSFYRINKIYTDFGKKTIY